ncbi:MAG: class I SAM-dependent methyltransferase, partial [Proteobacteria bacterium]|nr:class I SAM-dependent methyltransferase [Pseudomonadota bacterium]
MQLSWRERSAVFHDQAQDYDQWFEDSLLFAIELAAVRELQTPLDDPKIEVGVGPGRFAQALQVAIGVDPALAPLKFAQTRNIKVVQAIGEQLPFAGESAGSVFILFTLCFLAEPMKVLGECHRLLRPGGHLVLGMVPAAGAWGKALQAKKEKGHPFYRHASFYQVLQVVSRLQEEGFAVVESRSSLFQAPEELRDMEHSRPGLDEKAG